MITIYGYRRWLCTTIKHAFQIYLKCETFSQKIIDIYAWRMLYAMTKIDDKTYCDISYRIVYAILIGAGYICIYIYIFIYAYVCVFIYAYVYIYIYVPANACYYVYMIICMFADFMMFFTNGYLVRDDLLKKFKQKNTKTSGCLYSSYNLCSCIRIWAYTYLSIQIWSSCNLIWI